jgi:hypothetical protein
MDMRSQTPSGAVLTTWLPWKKDRYNPHIPDIPRYNDAQEGRVKAYWAQPPEVAARCYQWTESGRIPLEPALSQSERVIVLSIG